MSNILYLVLVRFFVVCFYWSRPGLASRLSRIIQTHHDATEEKGGKVLNRRVHLHGHGLGSLGPQRGGGRGEDYSPGWGKVGE